MEPFWSPTLTTTPLLPGRRHHALSCRRARLWLSLGGRPQAQSRPFGCLGSDDVDLERMDRRVFSVVVAVVLWASSIEAPFAHLHQGAADHDHDGAGHLHIGHLEDHHDGPVFDHPDDDATAVSQEWAGVTTAKVSLHFAVLSEVISFEAPVVIRWSGPEFVARSHDPPELLSTAPRAPPL